MLGFRSEMRGLMLAAGLGGSACGGDDASDGDDVAETSADDGDGDGDGDGGSGTSAADGGTSGDAASGSADGSGSGGADATTAVTSAGDRGGCGIGGGPSPADEHFVEVGTDDQTQQPAVRVELHLEGTCNEDPPAAVRMLRFDSAASTLEIVDEDGSVTPTDYMNETYAWPRLDVTATVESVRLGEVVGREITFTGPGGSVSASCDPSTPEMCVVVR
jgi:hypothetical protein